MNGLCECEHTLCFIFSCLFICFSLLMLMCFWFNELIGYNWYECYYYYYYYCYSTAKFVMSAVGWRWPWTRPSLSLPPRRERHHLASTDPWYDSGDKVCSQVLRSHDWLKNELLRVVSHTVLRRVMSNVGKPNSNEWLACGSVSGFSLQRRTFGGCTAVRCAANAVENSAGKLKSTRKLRVEKRDLIL